MEGNIQNENKINVDDFFSKVLEESEKNEELKILLQQTSIEDTKTIFALIKENLLKHDALNPKNWNDAGYNYGHIAIKTTDQNKNLAEKIFIIPQLEIEISVGKIRDIHNDSGMRIVWKKISS